MYTSILFLEKTTSNNEVETCTDYKEDENYMKIFYHNVKNLALFSTEQNVLDNSADDTFSMLGQLDKYKNIEGKFHLKICYPDRVAQSDVSGKCCNEWKQTSNPVSEGIITGFEKISLAWTKNCAGSDWHGLGLEGQFTHTLIDDTGENERWCMAVGAIKYEPDDDNPKKYIPGPYNEKIAEPRKVQIVEMLVRTGMMLTFSS